VLTTIRRVLGAESLSEVVRFGLVGASGVAVNSAFLYVFHGVLGWALIPASVFAVEAAIVNNFLWNDRWTFSARDKTPYRFFRFNLVSLGGLVVNTVVLALLVAMTGIHYLIANLIAIAAAMAWNFAANSRWTWRAARRAQPRPHFTKGETMTDDLVIVPTYNEAENIETLVNLILEQGSFSILIVDDRSPDGTGRIANALAHENQGRVAVLHRESKDGLGAAYRAGFAHGLENGASRIYQMDADLSHNPKTLPVIREALLDGADLVIGSRYVRGGGVVGWPWWRQALSRGGSLYAGTILGLPVRDLTGGFKGWRREALVAMRPEDTRSNGYAFQIETTYRAMIARARVKELPISFSEREFGASKMGWPIVFEAVRVVPALRMRRPALQRVSRRRVGSSPRFPD
jgi:dolichol-phosphate mannosyltransferase